MSELPFVSNLRSKVPVFSLRSISPYAPRATWVPTKPLAAVAIAGAAIIPDTVNTAAATHVARIILRCCSIISPLLQIRLCIGCGFAQLACDCVCVLADARLLQVFD